MAPKRKPATSGSQPKKRQSVLTLQEKMVVLGLLRRYFGLKSGTQIWPKHYIYIHITGCLKSMYFMDDVRDFQG
jgi:hypothetical protein